METTLPKIDNEVLSQMDRDKVIALALLNLSVSFDTIDQQILLHRLEKYVMGVATSTLNQITLIAISICKLENWLSPGSVLGVTM